MASRTLGTREKLSVDEVHALNASAFAADQFEPFVGRIVGPGALDRVIEGGLVEAGPSCCPAVGQIGYRLTSTGWTKFHRVALARKHSATSAQ